MKIKIQPLNFITNLNSIIFSSRRYVLTSHKFDNKSVVLIMQVPNLLILYISIYQ